MFNLLKRFLKPTKPGNSRGEELPIFDFEAGKLPPELCNRPLLLLIGNITFVPGDPNYRRLQRLFNRGLIPTVTKTGAAVLHIERHGKLTQIMASCLAHREERPTVAGIIENGGDTTKSKHNDFLIEAGPGGAVDTLFRLAATAGKAKQNVAVLLLGGHEEMATHVLYAVRHGWPVIALEDSGGVADKLMNAFLLTSTVDDPIEDEIVAEGKLHWLKHGDKPGKFAELLRLSLIPHESLRLAWGMYALYNLNATKHKRFGWRLQDSILLMSVCVVLLALLQTALFDARGVPKVGLNYQILHISVIAAPIMISILVAIASDSKSGMKYQALRSAAMAVKREIYQYRMGTGAYKHHTQGQDSVNRATLASRTNAIGEQLMESHMGESALSPYKGAIPPI